jgi:CubicO group peptidase (beta-lactamase class C family)
MKIKKLYIVLLILLAAIISYFQISLKPKLPILTGYAAKMMCSCSFIAQRDIESIKNEDLNFFPVSLASTEVDYNNKSVTSSFLGMAKQTANYTEESGCFLKHSEEKRHITSHKILNPSDSLSFAFHQLHRDSSLILNLDGLQSSIEKAFDVQDGNPVKKTRAVVVIHKGQLVGEHYAEGFNKNTPLLGWSMTKSIMNAMIGILVQKGQIDINGQAPIDAWANDERREITIDHLLNMESGLQWDEDYFNISDVTKMLYTNDNAPDVAIQKPLEFEPEEEWEYSSGTSNILSRIVRLNCDSYDEYLNFPYKELFFKIGMNTAKIETDAKGFYIGSSYCFATARDWAKFGLLYLNDGLWNGERILPEGWVKYTATPVKKSKGIYGAHFWLNHNNVAFKAAPADLFSANGFQGQRVFVIPSKDLVIVRMGLADSSVFDFNQFLKDILQHFTD